MVALRLEGSMLPAPFYAEVPADLGDDQTWVRQAAAGRRWDEAQDWLAAASAFGPGGTYLAAQLEMMPAANPASAARVSK